ncbi:MAG TPA: hypothetical protein VMF51_18145 [Nocardioides sp.]|uniref:hypothetical protein n=1 Tax=Nocardioides sp. TaxID=35761 RepID=UPI002D163D41|nr:hypothetical protein [Nocardioides sp.]HTW17057.1 hypothetical protein [Nocardioides sp.]
MTGWRIDPAGADPAVVAFVSEELGIPVVDVGEPQDALRLGSECLFSRFGFNDGDVPAQLLDYCDTFGLPYPTDDPAGRVLYDPTSAWHVTLAALVKERLVPLLPVEVAVEEIGTNHNPIRAKSVAGVDVDWSSYDAAEAAHTWPEVAIWIPYDQVLAEHERLAQS